MSHHSTGEEIFPNIQLEQRLDIYCQALTLIKLLEGCLHFGAFGNLSMFCLISSPEELLPLLSLELEASLFIQSTSMRKKKTKTSCLINFAKLTEVRCKEKVSIFEEAF